MLAATVAFSQKPQTFRIEVFQSHTENDIEGFVYDQAGQPVGDATVVLKNLGSGLENRVNTDADGWYKFNRLRTADSYELSVTLPKFENFDLKGVNISWKVATRLDIVLKDK
jgi:hypothetical protein